MEHAKGRHVGRVWFTSDLMLGSERAAAEQYIFPGLSVERMNESIIDRWNKLVGPQDTVWILGNLVGGQTSVDRSNALDAAWRLNGAKYLLAGPLDPCLDGAFPYASKEAIRYRERAGLKAVITSKAYTNVDVPPARRHIPIQIPLLGGPSHGYLHVVLSAFHYPEQAPNPFDDHARYRPRWDKRRAGQSPYLVHGEAPWVVKDYPGTPAGRSLNVSMPAWHFEPVPAEMVASLLQD